MLKQLRNKKTAKKIWIILAIIIVPPFILWGLGGALRSGKINPDISSPEYQEALQAVKNMALMRFGESFSEIQKFLNLEEEARGRILLLKEAARQKITATDKEVIDSIQSYPFFQHNGSFDNRTYSEVLRFVLHTKPRAFEEEARQNLIIQKLFNRVTREIKIGDEEIRDEYRKANEELSVSYVASLYADSAKEIKPTEEQIKDYFAKNSLQFRQPPTFNVEYIRFESEETAQDALKRIDRKEGLEKIAESLKLELKETGDFSHKDPIPGIGWSADIFGLISKMKIGEYSPAVKMDKFIYILRLKDKKDSLIPELEKVKDAVKEALIKEESEKTAKEKIEACRQKSATDPEKYAKELGLKTDFTKPFKFASYIEGIGASDNFWTKAQNLKAEESSEIISMPSGFYIIKIKDRIAMDESKFAAEKEEFSKKTLDKKKEEYFLKFLEGLKKKTG
jgi:peptidyl-prolyl cis-trans isomerase D